MRKIGILISVCLIVLTGCAQQSQDYDQIIEKAMSRPLTHSISRTKNALRYYVLPDVGVRETTDLSSVLDIENTTVVMSLSVSDIVARQYYDAQGFNSKITSDKVIYTKKGVYIDRNDRQNTYVFTVLDAEGKKLVVLENGLISLVGTLKDTSMALVVDSMFVTMRSVDVDEKEVATHYSNKTVVNYKAIHEEFFNHRVPESGTLYDIYNQLHPNDEIKVNPGTETPNNSGPSGMEGE